MDILAWQRIAAAYQAKQADADSMNAPVLDAATTAKRVEVNAETSKAQLMLRFHEKHFRAEAAWERLWPTSETYIGDVARAEIQNAGMYEELGRMRSLRLPLETTPLQTHIELINLTILIWTYDLDRGSERYGQVRDRAASVSLQQVFGLPDRLVSRGLWTEGVARAIFGGTYSEVAGSLSTEIEQTDYEMLLRRYAGRTANPRQHEQGDSSEKGELGASQNLMEEIEAATNAFVLDRAKRAVSAIDWLPTGRGNMCCLLRSMLMLVETEWSVYSDKIDPRVGEIKRKLQDEDLTPEQAKKKYEELGRRTDHIGRVLGILKYMRSSAEMLRRMSEVRQPMGNISFTAIVAAIVAPMLRKAIDDIYDDFENSPLSSLDQNKQFADVRRWMRNASKRVERDANADATKLAEMFATESKKESALSVIVKCGPAIDILEHLVFPVIDGTQELLQAVVYMVYEEILNRAKFEMDASEIAIVTDRMKFLDTFIKWVTQNLEPLVRNPRLCTSTEPTQEDIDNFTDFVKGVGGRGPGKGTIDVIQNTLAHAIDPDGFDRRFQELKNRVDRSPEDDRELDAMDQVRLIWAL